MTDHQEPAVGIFWFLLVAGKPTLIFHHCPLSRAEAYGDFLTCPHGHYDVWEGWRHGNADGDRSLRPRIDTYEYEEWPRGRVVWERTPGRFVIYADAKIHRAGLLPEVAAGFHLKDHKVVFRRDEHYQSTQKLIFTASRD